MILTMASARQRENERAKNYSQWQQSAAELDRLKKLDRWREKNKTRLYDFVSIDRRLSRLRALRQSGNYRGLMHALNEGIHGNMDGIGNARLYTKAKSGTKVLVDEYIREVSDALAFLADQPTPDIDHEEKIDFFQRAAHCFGRSALLLSGAGTLLYFHFGVLKALAEQDLLPNIISGSSGGAAVAAFAGTRSREQFLHDINLPQLAYVERDKSELSWRERVVGKTVSQSSGLEKLDELIPDLTFQEAYELSGIQINISISPTERHQKPRLLSATTSPTAMVREAVLASCAVPGVFPPVTLAARDEHGNRVAFLSGSQWLDGSLTGDLPLKRLTRLYGVNHTIVSQTNPLVLPFVDADKDPSGALSLARKSGLSLAKNLSLATSRLWRRPLSTTEVGKTMVNSFISLTSQSYTGDITILPRDRMSAYNPFGWLAEKSLQQVKALVNDGERATWPVVERIRNQTMISRELDRILQQYDHSFMHKKPRKKNGKKTK